MSYDKCLSISSVEDSLLLHSCGDLYSPICILPKKKGCNDRLLEASEKLSEMLEFMRDKLDKMKKDFKLKIDDLQEEILELKENGVEGKSLI